METGENLLLLKPNNERFICVYIVAEKNPTSLCPTGPYHDVLNPCYIARGYYPILAVYVYDIQRILMVTNFALLIPICINLTKFVFKDRYCYIRSA